MLKKGGSDLHFVAGDPPRIRLYGELHPLREAPLTKEFVRETLYEIMHPARAGSSWKKRTAPTSPT